MTWREDLRRVSIGGRQLIGASFRGVPFLVEAGERSGGRRLVVHEFPLRDDSFVEDMGRRALGFRVEGYVIGDDYMVQRDALLAALEDQAGPGELVHPYYGVLRVSCDTLGVRETRSEGGYALFSIAFAHAPNQAPVPTEVVDEAGQVAAAAAAAVEATKVSFVDRFNPAGMPAFAIASAAAALERAASTLGVLLAPVVVTTQGLAQLTGRVFAITEQASSLVRRPGDVVDEFRAVFADLTEAVGGAAPPAAVMAALIEAYDAALGEPPPATTATRRQEAANLAAITGALRQTMVIEASRLAPLVPFRSIEEASAARQRLGEQLEELSEEADDQAYPALVTLRSEVLRAVPGGRAFAQLVTVTRRSPIPSLLLTYQLYGKVDQELDVIARNNIRHPGIVVGDLKVLSDG
jgi:prophage DNA circulation protein